MTPEVLITHVEESIAAALRHQSWIDQEILEIRGFASGVFRRLISNLCHLPKRDPVYAEVGLYCGASFGAAINHNPTLHAYGIEDFSQDFNTKSVRDELKQVLDRYCFEAASVTTYDGDFFAMNLDLIDRPVDIFYYDGCHDYKSQEAALPKMLPALNPLFLYIVDDYNWSCVREGTIAGIESLGFQMTLHRQWLLQGEKLNEDKTWHNGVALFVGAKTNLR